MTETTEHATQYSEYGHEPLPKPKGSGSKGKLTKSDEAIHKKAMIGKDNEKALAEKIEALIPLIEKEEAVSARSCTGTSTNATVQRVQRQKKKVAAAFELAQLAEVRSTRTRRPTRKIDYSYNDDVSFTSWVLSAGNQLTRVSGRRNTFQETSRITRVRSHYSQGQTSNTRREALITRKWSRSGAHLSQG
jgi:hypothetical protein